jgi:prefoldin subunit 5
MPKTQILEQIANDVAFLKNQIIEIRVEINEINADLHEVRPEYKKKIEKILKEGKFENFSSVSELRREIEHV